MNQRIQLAKPFLSKFVHQKPGARGGSYVSHDVVNQYLLRILGPFDWTLVEVLRCDHKDLHNVISGAVWRMTCTIDGERVTVEEVGDCENPSNWQTDGARLKDSSSDAIKRCAMRLGLGLHLWSQEEYVLFDALQSDAKERPDRPGPGTSIPGDSGVVGQGSVDLVGAKSTDPASEGTINA